jgi:Transglutaminase-like superfamily
MKQILSLLILLLSFQQAYSQNKYADADSVALLVKGDDVAEIHQQLTENLITNEEKARAFYSWITHHIQYDVAESLRSEKIYMKQDPQQVLKSKKAICHGYSSLFLRFCELSQIPCYLVSGYTRLDGKYDAAGHTWNVVYVNGKWQPVDATWGAGGVDSRGKYIKAFTGKYFLAGPVDFLYDHYPFDPMWQLVYCPVKLADYKSINWHYSEKASCQFNYSDTIASWEKLDSLDREYSAALRMLRFSPGDPVIKEQLSYALFTKGNAEFEKGNMIMAILFPRKQPVTQQQQSTLQNKSIRIAQLNSIENYYRNAEIYYRQVQLSEPSEKAVLKSNIEALKYNREVVKKEKERLAR